MANGERLVTGQLDWASGIDSSRPTTIAGPGNPHGLKPNQLAFLVNGTCRGGGINVRTGWTPRFQGAPWSGLFQGGYIYTPTDDSDPYLVIAIGGHIWKVDLNTYAATDISAAFGLFMPVNQPLFHFVQAEQYLVIQAGDYASGSPTNPLFWDGGVLVRSRGFIAPGDVNNQIPSAGAMDYYMNRIWYARGRTYIAGDIKGGIYGILSTTENPFALSGDGLTVPSNAGNIRMLAHTAELDTQLGQARMLIGTTKSIYRLNVPVTRDDWSDPNFSNAQPLQTIAQIRYGPVGDRSDVVVNGDLFYQTLEPGIRSFTYSQRYFQQWGNTPISRNENRVLRFNDRALLRYSSGIEFNNRLLQTALPYQSTVGVAHRGILPLDFDLISTLEEKLPPAWEGMYEGLNFLQLYEGDFGGLQRAFAAVVSKTGEIEIWELTQDQRFDAGDRRISMVIETPSFTWGDPFRLKELDTLELWVDKILGKVEFEAYYRPDQYPCYFPWHKWQECTAKDCTEDIDNPCGLDQYPKQPYCESFKATMMLPKPVSGCVKQSGRPSTLGYQFQIKLVVKGWARVRGLLVYANDKGKTPYEGIVC